MDIKRSGKYIAVKVPERSSDFEIRTLNKIINRDLDTIKVTCVRFKDNRINISNISEPPTIEIPQGNYEILGLISEMRKADILIFGSMFEALTKEEWSQWLILKEE